IQAYLNPTTLYSFPTRRSYDLGSLKDTNQTASDYDNEISALIRDEKIDGLILMSIDPNGANKQAIEAAVEKNITIVGTGGTAMATVSSKGANVISTSGTTGTTNRTRAISFISSLSKHWGIKYRPSFAQQTSGNDNNNENKETGNPFKRINIRGIMISSLPAFISMALILALSKIPTLSGLGDVFDLI